MYQRILVAMLISIAGAVVGQAEELFQIPKDVQSRWASFENPDAAPGAGGQANRGGKGAAFAPVAAGETVVLLDTEGSGTVRRMWFTLRDRNPEQLRAFVIRMYWDGSDTPAVEAPFGDFFAAILGHMRPFENAFFSSPEGRSFNCIIPMPFRSGAKITFTNESEKDLPQLYYDVNFTLNETHDDSTLYFHSIWRRDPRTALAKDFEILPYVAGRGRFLGAHIGIIGHADNVGWWGEGEVKIFLDGDGKFATLVGTGTEDYIGTAYGQGEFINRYQGSPLIDNEKRHWTMYRYHVPDPVYFHKDIRVTIQQMGGAGKSAVLKLLETGVEIQPVSIQGDDFFLKLLEQEPAADLLTDDLPDGWTNMYRRDDVCATAFFYLDAPTNGLPPMPPVAARVAGLGR